MANLLLFARSNQISADSGIPFVSLHQRGAVLAVMRKDLHLPSALVASSVAVKPRGTCDIPAPAKYQGYTIIYYAKSGDGGRVRDILRNENIPFGEGCSSEGHLSGVTNGLACGSNIPLNIVREIATALTNHGIGIQSFSRLSSPNKSMTVEILNENYLDNSPLTYLPFTTKEISTLSNCDWSKVDIRVKNSCAHSFDARVWVYYSEDDEYKLADVVRVGFGSSVYVTKYGQKVYSGYYPYFYAYDRSNGLTWPGTDKYFPINGQEFGFRYVNDNVIELICPDQ
jgi:hypothetical protein